MRVPKIKIRNVRTGVTRNVNVSDWASDLGRGGMAGWEAVRDEQNVGTDPESPSPAQTVHEVGKVAEPKEEVVEVKPEAYVPPAERAAETAPKEPAGASRGRGRRTRT